MRLSSAAVLKGKCREHVIKACKEEPVQTVVLSVPAMIAPHRAGAELPCFQENLLRCGRIDVMVCRLPTFVELDHHERWHSQGGTHHVW